jgi:hypothetical protein
MAGNKQQPNPQVRHDSQRPAQVQLSRELSGLRAAQAEALIKGQRPIQEGARPAQGQPQGSLGPVSQKPGSGVPAKPDK